MSVNKKCHNFLYACKKMIKIIFFYGWIYISMSFANVLISIHQCANMSNFKLTYLKYPYK